MSLTFFYSICGKTLRTVECCLKMSVCVLPGLDDADGVRARDAHVPAAGVLAQCPDPSRARDPVHGAAEDPPPSRQYRIVA
jgi:hypothetical protein